MAKTVLVINSGSSSIKYQLVDLETGEGIASGLVEKIGEPVDGHYKHEFNGEKHELEEPIHDHEQGLKRVLGFFNEFGPKLDEAGIVLLVTAWCRVVPSSRTRLWSPTRPSTRSRTSPCSRRCTTVRKPRVLKSCARSCRTSRRSSCSIPPSSSSCRRPQALRAEQGNRRPVPHPPLRRPRHLPRVHLLRGAERHR